MRSGQRVSKRPRARSRNKIPRFQWTRWEICQPDRNFWAWFGVVDIYLYYRKMIYYYQGSRIWTNLCCRSFSLVSIVLLILRVLTFSGRLFSLGWGKRMMHGRETHMSIGLQRHVNKNSDSNELPYFLPNGKYPITRRWWMRRSRTIVSILFVFTRVGLEGWRCLSRRLRWATLNVIDISLK